MCTTLIAVDLDQKYPLILLHNRDEYTSRKCTPMARQPSSAIYGVDCLEGGTWLGVNQQHMFALITNYRDPKNRRENVKSRGLIVKEILTKDMDVEQVSDFLMSEADKYNPFNIVFGNPSGVFCFSSVQRTIEAIPTGMHGLSNSNLNTPWPKIKRGKNLLGAALQSNWTDSDLLSLMTDEERPEKADLPATGLPLDQEMLVSAIFINHPSYQTRSTTLLKFDDSGQFTIREISYTDGQIVNTESFCG